MKKGILSMQALNKLGYLIIPLILISACKGLKVDSINNSNSSATISLLVNNHKVECTALKIDLCLQIKEKGSSSDWKEYAADIKDFNYKWGYDYELEVTFEDISPAPSDSPSREYTLSSTISKTKAPKTDLFELTISRDETANLIKLVGTSITIYRIYDEVDIECASTTECTTIKDNITQDNAIKFILSHNTNLSKPLNISSIACTSARSSFATDCK